MLVQYFLNYSYSILSQKSIATTSFLEDVWWILFQMINPTKIKRQQERSGALRALRVVLYILWMMQLGLLCSLFVGIFKDFESSIILILLCWENHFRKTWLSPRPSCGKAAKSCAVLDLSCNTQQKHEGWTCEPLVSQIAEGSISNGSDLASGGLGSIHYSTFNYYLDKA
jgi:hypothetical protein